MYSKIMLRKLDALAVNIRNYVEKSEKLIEEIAEEIEKNNDLIKEVQELHNEVDLLKTNLKNK